jgi:hypothetical protein
MLKAQTCGDILLKWFLNMCWSDMDSTGSGYRQVAVSYEQCNNLLARWITMNLWINVFREVCQLWIRNSGINSETFCMDLSSCGLSIKSSIVRWLMNWKGFCVEKLRKTTTKLEIVRFPAEIRTENLNKSLLRYAAPVCWDVAVEINECGRMLRPTQGAYRFTWIWRESI